MINFKSAENNLDKNLTSIIAKKKKKTTHENKNWDIDIFLTYVCMCIPYSLNSYLI